MKIKTLLQFNSIIYLFTCSSVVGRFIRSARGGKLPSQSGRKIAYNRMFLIHETMHYLFS